MAYQSVIHLEVLGINSSEEVTEAAKQVRKLKNKGAAKVSVTKRNGFVRVIDSNY